MRLIDSRCRWVRDRLALKVGGELTGSDRRVVERHLITCEGCREHDRSLNGAMAALRESATQIVATAGEFHSLWPELQRQIRESKHESGPLEPFRIPGWQEILGTVIPARPIRSAAVLALGLVLGGMAATAIGVWSRLQVDTARAFTAAAARPIPYGFGPPSRFDLPIPGADELHFEAGTSVARSDVPVPTDPPRGPSKVGYDLDRGTPMGGDSGDVKVSY